MGEISRALGTPVEFTWKEKTYKLNPWKYDIMGEYENYLQEGAMRTLKRMKRFLTEKEYTDLAAQTRKDIDVGTYTFGSEEVAKSFDCPIHFAYLTWLSLKEFQPDVVFTDVRDMVREIGDVLADKTREANSDPNLKTQDS